MVELPLDPILKLVGLGAAILIAFLAGSSMMSSWTTLSLYWYAPRDASTVDPIFGNPLSFSSFALPAWQLIAGWLLVWPQ